MSDASLTTTHPPEPWYLRFHDLMRFMVREILLVSSAYDAFILEEDGRLDERLFSVYTGLTLPSIPRITHATSAKGAMDLLAERRFDLLITVVRLEDTDAGDLSERVKAVYPNLPIVLLAFDEADLRHFPDGSPRTVDNVFLWTGDAQILIAAIKLVEDAKNVAQDTENPGVQVIVVVEDSLRRYSTFLALLYAELMTQARSLIFEGLNTLHRTLRMRARPKILLATSFEEAVLHLGRYGDNLMALISDVRFPRSGREDPEAGFELVALVRKDHADLPILLQSAEPEVERRATALSVSWANKNSPTLLEQIRGFLKEGLGFGDFVFRLPDRTEVGRARDVGELWQVLKTVPLPSVEYHARRNHFSMWCNARGRFELSAAMRPLQVSEFSGIEELRQFLIDAVGDELAHEQEGVIADFSRQMRGPEKRFVRLGGGSIGGKGRGIAFVHSVLARHALQGRFPDLEIRIPKTIVLGTEGFDRFLADNGISRDRLATLDDREITETFLRGKLDDRLGRDLEVAFRDLVGPVAVRSSSLLEDSRFQPFAGIYATIMLPNTLPEPRERFLELCRAVAAVYASTFCRDARSYFAGMPHSVEEEKMAVVIQEMVGSDFGERFYPPVAGVAQSHNYYPVGPQRAEDGVALIALGLGHAVVSGALSLRFCPRNPGVLPQFASARDFLLHSQSRFYALDLTRATVDFLAGAESSLGLYDLDVAERDGSLAHVGSVYVAADDVIRDNLNLPGPRVVTFNNILKWGSVPLPEALSELLAIFRQGMGSDVEIEFAVDLVRGHSLYVLQVRPMATQVYQDDVQTPRALQADRLFVQTSRALGHGRIDDLRDVVYVKRISIDSQTTRAVAREVGQINAELQGRKRPYLLIGPGRWGTSDPALGIPVDWGQIAGARVIVETCHVGSPIEPSQGTHFLQNITFLRIGYLTVLAQEPLDDEEGIAMSWLDAKPSAHETGSLRHVELDLPLSVLLDGRHGTAVILRPG